MGNSRFNNCILKQNFILENEMIQSVLSSGGSHCRSSLPPKITIFSFLQNLPLLRYTNIKYIYIGEGNETHFRIFAWRVPGQPGRL